MVMRKMMIVTVLAGLMAGNVWAMENSNQAAFEKQKQNIVAGQGWKNLLKKQVFMRLLVVL